MTRRYEDPVQVRRVVRPGQSGDGAPAMFLWRGRLYVVREVLGHWWERRAWWAEADARAVHGEPVPGGDSPGAEPGGPEGRRIAGTPSAAVARSGTDREVWRVEASPGSAYGSGVYDLEASPPQAGGTPTLRAEGGPAEPAGVVGAAPTWRLLRVAD